MVVQYILYGTFYGFGAISKPELEMVLREFELILKSGSHKPPTEPRAGRQRSGRKRQRAVSFSQRILLSETVKRGPLGDSVGVRSHFYQDLFFS